MNTAYVYLLILLIIVFIGFILLIVEGRSENRRYSIPSGREQYNDMESSGKVLRSHRFALTGKPDRVIRKKNKLIVYEFKSTRGNMPRTGHILQMGTYFIILEEMYPQYDVEYGILRYQDHTFRVENTQRLRDDVLEIADRIRATSEVPDFPVRNHNNPAKCLRCPFRESCSQSLIVA
ncbi:MAG: PD-(D/E)XK nuclease family protein [Candidatus Thermoplasmatota archaeon]|nr:PD-(D/E)XK nuclease family protein [Candidatus Thermoplasmatota archaeon]